MIEGRVAQILNDRELVINRGRNDGVQHGMTFAVLMGDPLQVSDPETGESLGMLERTKISIRVSELHEKFALCERRKLRELGESRIAPAGFFSPRGRGSSVVADETNVDVLPKEDRAVRVGDRVKQTSVSEAIPFSTRPRI